MSLIIREPSDTFLYNMLDFPRYFKSCWLPPTNFVEKNNAIEVSMEIAGIKPDDIKIILKNDKLIITGNKSEDHKDEKTTYYFYERSYGYFLREFPVYSGTKHEDISATVNNGVLNIFVKKNENFSNEKEKTIPILYN